MGDTEFNTKNTDVESAMANESGENPGVDLSGTLADPRVLEALKQKVSNALMPLEIPKFLKRKVKALKKLQMEHINSEIQFFKELHNLEVKYEKIFTPLYDKRHQIISGAVVPTDEECDFPSDVEDDEDEEELVDGVKKVQVDDKEEDDNIDVKGIPEFWLTAFKNAPVIAEIIEEHDEPILKHLMDVKVKTSIEPMGFDLEFHFEPNDFFTNTVLVKHYDMQCSPDKGDPFSFDGPEIVKCRGCQIEWKKGKNVTVRTVKKKQKHKSRGSTRVITKSVQNDSFFNFFSPPPTPDDTADVDDDTRAAITSDFEIGNLIKDRIIPQGVLFFTGENLVDDDYDEDEEEDEEEGEDEEEEESDEETESGSLVKKPNANKQPAPPECKQQ